MNIQEYWKQHEIQENDQFGTTASDPNPYRQLVARYRARKGTALTYILPEEKPRHPPTG
jgi:hypothetical protein